MSKPKRAPKQVWIAYSETALVGTAFRTKKAALAKKWKNETVSGPYILAERVGTK